MTRRTDKVIRGLSCPKCDSPIVEREKNGRHYKCCSRAPFDCDVYYDRFGFSTKADRLARSKVRAKFKSIVEVGLVSAGQIRNELLEVLPEDVSNYSRLNDIVSSLKAAECAVALQLAFDIIHANQLRLFE